VKYRSILTNVAGILTSRIFGYLRDLLMASILGANIYTDIFFVAFKLPNLFRRIFAEGAFTQTFLPVYTQARHRSVFAVAILWRFALILLLLSIGVTFAQTWVTKLIAVGFDEATVQIAAPLVAINFYYLDLIFLVTFLAALLQYRSHFATTAFATVFLNLSMIGALLLFRNAPAEKIVYALSWAVLAGGAAQLVAHLWTAQRLGILRRLRVGARNHRIKVAQIHLYLQTFLNTFIPAIYGNATAQLAAFIDTWLASFLTAGSISYLYYANRLFQLPHALFATAASTTLFPAVTKLLEKGEIEEARTHTRRVFWIVTALLGGASMVAWILATPIVQLLFERGAFQADDTAQTAWVLIMYIVGLLPYGLAKLFTIWLNAQLRQKEVARIATQSLGVNILFSLMLIHPMGAAGLALATSFGGWVAFWLTVRAVGLDLFWATTRSKYALPALLFTLFSAAAAWVLKVYLLSV